MGEEHLDLLSLSPGGDVGVGLGDVAGVEGIQVYQCNLGPGRAFLYSGLSLQRVAFAPLRGVGEIAEVQFVEMENPQKSGC